VQDALLFALDFQSMNRCKRSADQWHFLDCACICFHNAARDGENDRLGIGINHKKQELEMIECGANYFLNGQCVYGCE
jgi:hypothetical protein